MLCYLSFLTRRGTRVETPSGFGCFLLPIYLLNPPWLRKKIKKLNLLGGPAAEMAEAAGIAAASAHDATHGTPADASSTNGFNSHCPNFEDPN
jgi:hypothetical protein